MAITIENENLTAQFAEFGAELTSLKSKKNDIEYLWQADPEFWGRHAPILFPFVGRLKGDQYKYKGKTYPMSQHGFARDKEFEIIESSADSITFLLKSDEETLKVYPFAFELKVKYQLLKNGIKVVYEVNNSGSDEMLFSIGAHPAFNVPLAEGLSFEDYFLQFTPQKSRVRIPLKGAYIDYDQRTLGQTNTSLSLTREMFAQDALIFETKGDNAFSICSEQSSHSVTLSYDNMPYVGFWTPYQKEAPFVCIEPWCGIADRVDTNGELTEKTAINHLPAGKQFVTSYEITVK